MFAFVVALDSTLLGMEASRDIPQQINGISAMLKPRQPALFPRPAMRKTEQFNRGRRCPVREIQSVGVDQALSLCR